MIFVVPANIEFINGKPGTAILTGTPEGIGAAMKPPVFFQPGDTVPIDIETIGAPCNPVVSESNSSSQDPPLQPSTTR